MNAWLRLVSRRPGLVLLAAALLTAAALAGIVDPRSGTLRLWVDPSVGRLLPEDDAERRYYERVRRVFGSDESVVVALASEDAFSPPVLRAVERLAERLAALPGVHDVTSLASARSMRSDEAGLDLASFTQAALGSPDELPELRAEALANPLVRGALLSEDARMTALVATLASRSDRELLESGLLERIREAADAEAEAVGARVFLTGAPVVKAATSDAILRQLARVLPAIAAVAAVVLLLAFASVRGAVLPLLTILLAAVWTLGTVAWLGRPLNLVTSIVPPLVVTVGLAYAMHVVAEYYRTLRGGEAPRTERGGEAREFADEGERIAHALGGVGLPVAVAGLTTAAGFLALCLSPLAAIREFGWMSVLGVLYTVVLSLSVLPAGLRLFGRVAHPRPPPGAAALERAAERLGRLDVRHRRLILGAGAGLLALGLLGTAGVRVGDDYIRHFPADAPVRADYEAINEALSGANPFTIVVETNLNDALVHPEMLRELEALQRWLERQPEVGSTTSVVDHLKLLHRGLRGEGAELELPESQRLAKQLLVFAGGEAIEGVVDSLFHSAAVQVRARVDDSQSIAALLERIEGRLSELPLPMQARVTGQSVLVNHTVERIARGQLASVGAALLVVYVILSALFSSLRVGVLALLPNALPIAVYFGTLGATGVTLNPSTSLIACIALGVAVDDTIHYLVRFNGEARRRGNEEAATLAALRGVIRPVTFTSIALVAGFLVLTASELRNQVQFGALAAFTLAVAWAVDVTLTPALCAGVRIVTLWDLLRLDLGPEPQRTIPLFEGLSLRHARLFALTADIQTFRAGEVVRREGEPADDLFVVLDGELAVWADRDGKRVDLYTVRRGDVVGEVGFFAQRHRATVEALVDARLLRFEDVDLELMVRRHPRAAATIYRNLNHVQASLLVRATDRMR